jgi:hypothetical protein
MVKEKVFRKNLVTFVAWWSAEGLLAVVYF